MEDLTILITLKDRSSYTYRLMRHLNETKCPFKILLADGGADKNLEDNLRNRVNYPNVNYRYVRYPYDEDFPTYYSKMKNSALEVDTPYVLAIDNDDLICAEGVQKSIDFLKDNPNYVASRGALQGFSCDHIPGPNEYGAKMYSEFPDDITGDSACERIIDQSNHFHGNWHSVMYTNHLVATTTLIEEFNPTNLRFVEQLYGFLNVVWGNSNREEYDYLYHQHGTPRVDGGDNQFPAQDAWIVETDWPKNLAKMIDAITVGVIAQDNLHQANINSVRSLITKHYREMYYKRVTNRDLLDTKIDNSKDCYRSNDQLMLVVNQIKNIL